MSVGSCVCLVLAVQNLITRCTAQYITFDWFGADWAYEGFQVTEPVNDTKEWVHYLHTLAEEYEEYPERRTTIIDGFVRPLESELARDPPDWYPLAPFEDPYTVVLYRRDSGADPLWKSLFPNDPDHESTHIFPGTACGGVLLATRHVLTSCGCLISLVVKVFGLRDPFRVPGTSTFDIFDADIYQLTPIYVSRVVKDFVPYFKSRIEMDKKNWSSSEILTCQSPIKQVVSGNYDEAKKIAVLNAAPIVVPILPEIPLDYLRFFPKWPPLVINRGVDPAYKARVQLISIGMKLTKPGRFRFYSSNSASVTEMLHCNKESIVCNSNKIQLGIKATCFCPIRPGFQKLSGGVVGWPIVVKGVLVGIAGSERHTTDGSMVGIVLEESLIKNIEEYISKKVLEDANTPPPQYRQRALKKKFLIYDYDIYKAKITPPDRDPRRDSGDFSDASTAISVATCISPTALAVFSVSAIFLIIAA